MNRKRIWLLLAALALALTAIIGGTVAWLQDQPRSARNTMIPSRVPNQVEEDLDGNVKNNVRIRCTGNVDAYIRAAVTVNWVDDSGGVSGEKPLAGTDFTWDLTMEGWKLGADGYFYHLTPVAPGDSTGILFTNCQPKAEKKGFHLSVEIMGQSIQALGMDGDTPVVVAEWEGVTAVAPDAGLIVKEAA